MIRIADLKLPLALSLDAEQEILSLRRAVSKKLGMPETDFQTFSIARKSLDARKKNDIHYVYAADVQLASEAEQKLLQRASGVIPAPLIQYSLPTPGESSLACRPVVVGFGPAGIFAAWALAKQGYRPLVLERGQPMETRAKAVQTFWNEGILNPESNVQFGEGGAGAFSDGKLTTLIGDPRCHTVLDLLVQFGAPEEISYLRHPHIGTDLLRGVVQRLRQYIEQRGGKVRFGAKVTGVTTQNGKLQSLQVNGEEEIPCSLAVFAVGHSARDTFAMLHGAGFAMEQKPFSIGVRIEHSQELIDRAQYGDTKGLPPADYKLVYHAPSGRSAYSFCMCPGGFVVASSSETGGVTTNGMSFQARAGQNANSALLVGVTPADFGGDHPLAGVEFQRRWEHKAFALAGGNYSAPAQRVEDFLARRSSSGFGAVHPTYRPSPVPGDMADILPTYVVETLREAIPYFNRKLKGFALPDAVLTGPEIRSSSPVRILRRENMQSLSVEGFYPIGEGAGYAGGIVSSAVDGLKAAEQIIAHWRPTE